MDIKDLILIVGGLLIAAVIVHGLWIAWRARRDPLRLDLVTDLPPADADDIRHFHAELPNGGSRVIEPGEVPRQEALELGEAAEERPAAAPRTQRREPRLEPGPGAEDGAAAGSPRQRREPGLSREPDIIDAAPRPARDQSRHNATPERPAAADQSLAGRETGRAAGRETGEITAGEFAAGETVSGHSAAEAAADAPAADRVADVIMPERSGRLDEPKEPRRWARKVPGPAAADDGIAGERHDPTDPRTGPERQAADSGARRGGAASAGTRSAVRKSLESRRNPADSRRASEPGGGAGKGSGSGRAASGKAAVGKSADHRVEAPVQELIMINLLAPKGDPFTGAGLVESLRARGLRYGDMNIFHRQDPVSRTSWYSVANVVEPGTFDMTDLDNFRSPGVCFFLQLPGPENPLEVFEDMLKVARDVAVRVGGELKDEQRSVMTGQTVEHYRQRISEFCRRRMSMRA